MKAIGILMQNCHSIPKSLLLAICLVMVGLPIYTQNLVPNPDFNTYSICPFGSGQISLAPPWYSPNGSTTDFAHICAGTNDTGIPNNKWGSEITFAGNGYAGIRTWGTFNGNGSYREYLATQLLDSLIAGEAYRLSFRISLGDSARYLTDDIGLYVSKDSIPSDNLLPFTPHISNPQGKVIMYPSGWHKISGQYLATGGEKHIVIGNFLDDSQTTIISRNLPEGLGRNSTYFFIDHVVVEPCSEEFPDRLFTAMDTAICPGESIDLLIELVPGGMYSWEDGSKDTLRSVNEAGLYVLKTEINGCFELDSIEITVAPSPVFELGADTSLCPGESLIIGVEDTVDRFSWNDFHPKLNRRVDTAGVYVLELALGPCLYSDSIQIAYEDIYLPAAPKDTLICLSSAAFLQASFEGASYTWSDMSDKINLAVREDGQYWVDIETACFSARELFRVAMIDCGCESFIPNVFTPNGDGINDEFHLSFKEGISNYSIQIFDRYGQEVFSSNRSDEGWTGSKNGQILPEGVYYWVAQYRCYGAAEFRQELRKGHVSLFR